MNQMIEQIVNKPCPECGGQRIITKTSTAGVLISVGIIASTMTIPISCTICGYTALFVADPDKVRDHYLKQ